MQLDPAIHVTQSIASSSEQQEHEESGPSNDCQLVGARLDGYFGLAVELVTIASVGPGHPAFFLSCQRTLRSIMRQVLAQTSTTGSQ